MATNLAVIGATPGWEDVLRYWRAKHKDGRPPSRRELDPVVDVPPLTKHLILLDIAPDGYRFRLVGTAAQERLGVELTGRLFPGPRIPHPAEEKWTAAFDAVRTGVKPKLVIAMRAGLAQSRHTTIILPLVDSDGVVRTLLLGWFQLGDLGDTAQFPEVSVQEILDKGSPIAAG
jgi:hypothetical protein